MESFLIGDSDVDKFARSLHDGRDDVLRSLEAGARRRLWGRRLRECPPPAAFGLGSAFISLRRPPQRRRPQTPTVCASITTSVC